MSVDALTSLCREEEEWKRRLEETKLRFKLTEFSTQHVESTIGFEENQRLRDRLDYLHEEYNTTIGRQNHLKAETLRSSTRFAGMGSRREITNVSNTNIRTSTHYRKSLGNVSNLTTQVVSRPSINTSTYIVKTGETPRTITRRVDAYGNPIDENAHGYVKTTSQGQWLSQSGVQNGQYITGNMGSSNVIINGGTNGRTSVYEVVKQPNVTVVQENEIARVGQAMSRYVEEMNRRG